MQENYKYKIKELFKNYRHLLLLLYYFVIILFYIYVNKNILVGDIELYMKSELLDHLIPFCKYMVIPYVMWYPYIAIAIIYFAFMDKEAYYKLCAFMFGGMTICYIFCVLVPNGIGPHFRPELVDDDIFSRILNRIYTRDNPTNSCPSIHVLNSVVIYSTVKNSKSFRKNKWVKTFSLILTIAICASTVLVKQHSIIDVFASLLLCSLIYPLLYSKKNVKSMFRKRHKHWYNEA
jgi:membrane-associated phospholipid phosphatase